MWYGYHLTEGAMNSLNTKNFREDLLRLYLGKYANRFKPLADRVSIVFVTDPHPLLVVKLLGADIALYEYIEVEKEDPYFGAFDYYCIEIITVPIGDPCATKTIETAVAKSFLAGTHK